MSGSRFNLIPDDLKARLPGLGASPYTQLESMTIHARFFLPGSNWSWYALEFDGSETFLMIVLNGSEAAIGQVTLEELAALHTRDSRGEGIGVCLDSDFSPDTVGRLARDLPSLQGLFSRRADLVEIDTDPEI